MGNNVHYPQMPEGPKDQALLFPFPGTEKPGLWSSVSHAGSHTGEFESGAGDGKQKRRGLSDICRPLSRMTGDRPLGLLARSLVQFSLASGFAFCVRKLTPSVCGH